MSRNRDNEAFPKILRDRAQGRARSHTESRGTDVVETIARRMAEAEAKRRAGGKLGSAKDSVVAVAGRSFGESHEKRVNTLLPKAMAYLRQGLTEAELAEVIKAFDFDNDRLPDWPQFSVRNAVGKIAAKATVAVQGEALTPEQEAEFAEWYRKAQTLVNDVADGIVEPEEAQAELKQYNVWFSTSRGAMREENRRYNNPQNKLDRYINLANNPQQVENRVWQAYEAELNRRDKTARRENRRAAISQAATGVLESAKRTVVGASQTAQATTAEVRDRLNGLVERSRGQQPQPDTLAEDVASVRSGLAQAGADWRVGVYGEVVEFMMNPTDGVNLPNLEVIGSLLEQQGLSRQQANKVVAHIYDSKADATMQRPAAEMVAQKVMREAHLINDNWQPPVYREPASSQQPVQAGRAARTVRPQVDMMTTVAMPISATQPRQAASPQPQALHPQAEQALRAAAETFNHLQAGREDDTLTPEQRLKQARAHVGAALGNLGYPQDVVNRIGAEFEARIQQGATAADALVAAAQGHLLRRAASINPTLQAGQPMAGDAKAAAPAGTPLADRAMGRVDKVVGSVKGMAGKLLPKSDVLRDARKKAHKLVADKLGEGLAEELGFHLRHPQDVQTVIDALVDHVNKVEGPHGITEEGYSARSSDVVSGMRNDPEFAKKVERILENGKGDSKRNIARLTDEIVKRVVSQYEQSDSSERFADRFSAPKTYPSYQDDALKSFKANKAEIEAQAAKAKAEADHKAALDAAQKEAAAARAQAEAAEAARQAEIQRVADLEAALAAEAEAQAQAAAEKQAAEAEAEADRLAAEAEAAKAAEQPSQAKPDAAAATAEAERQQAEQVAKESEKAEEFAVRAVNALRGGTAPEPLVKGKTSTELREETFAAFGNYVSTLRAEIDELESIRHSFMRGYVTSMVVKNAQSFEDIETIDALIESKRAELAKAAGQEAADKSKPKEVDPDDKDLVW